MRDLIFLMHQEDLKGYLQESQREISQLQIKFVIAREAVLAITWAQTAHRILILLYIIKGTARRTIGT